MKTTNHWTHKQCNKIISENKDNTVWFNNSIEFETMYNMLRYRMQFGEAETSIILASLIKAGAKFKERGI